MVVHEVDFFHEEKWGAIRFMIHRRPWKREDDVRENGRPCPK